MGCGCEDGYRDTHIGVIVKVFDQDSAKQLLSSLKKSVPEAIHRIVAELVEKRGADAFSVTAKLEDGSDMSLSGDLLPGDIEWARAMVGKRVQFTMTQLPKRGGFSVDVAEMAEA